MRSESCVRCSPMYELIQHTADIRIRVTAPSIEELFRDSLVGLMSYISGEALPPRSPASARNDIRVEGPDRTALLIDFLNEALLRSHLDHVIFGDVTFAALTETSLSAQLIPVEAEVAEDVKAVTYHEADIRRQDDGTWTTTIVLDI
jgi:SHS2 domain-containing protein